MTYGHKRIECSDCGTVIRQCRCPGPKAIKYERCIDCMAKVNAQSVLAAIEKTNGVIVGRGHEGMDLMHVEPEPFDPDDYAIVGGGIASKDVLDDAVRFSAILSGSHNTVMGSYSTIIGGTDNVVNGNHCLVMGCTGVREDRDHALWIGNVDLTDLSEAEVLCALHDFLVREGVLDGNG